MSKKFSELTTPEQWEWHTNVYAWRRVRLGVSREEHTSPPDPQGVWFRADMVDEAEAKLRQKIEGQVTTRTQKRDEALIGEAETIKNAWARQHGYVDFEDYKTRNGLDDVDAACNVARSLIAAAVIKGREAFAEPPDRDPKTLLKALGVSARERIYDAEALRRARIALGIELAQQAAE